MTESRIKSLKSSVSHKYLGPGQRDPYWDWDKSVPFIIVIKPECKAYKDNYKYVAQDRQYKLRITSLIEELKSGYLFEDDPDSSIPSRTHCNTDSSKVGKGYVAWTKDIDRSTHNYRLTYYVYKPVFIEKDEVFLIEVALRGIGHTFNQNTVNRKTGRVYKKNYTESDDPLRTLSEWESDL